MNEGHDIENSPEYGHHDELDDTTDDPKIFIDNFLQSKQYKKCFDNFYKNKKLAPDVTEKEKKETFLGMDCARVALLEFYEDISRFKYNPTKFPEASGESLKIYINSVKEMNKKFREGAPNDEMIQLDKLRGRYHAEAAEKMVADHIVPSKNIGLGMASIVTISLGLDTSDEVKVPTIQRLENSFK